MGVSQLTAKVLIVDDEPSVLTSTRLLLTELGYHVATVGTPGEVLPAIRRERPDVVLQDVRMPGLDLDAHLRAIRADADVGSTPIVLFSASLELPEIEARVNAAGSLGKPCRPEEVETVIASAIQRSGRNG